MVLYIIPNMKSIIIDTNVLVTALMSNSGASSKLMSLIGTKKFKLSISTALILEYEDVAKRHCKKFKPNQIDDVLDYICSESNHVRINYLWRPLLKDPNDELILELAVAAGADYIVTYNMKDFVGTEKFGIKVVTPKVFLQLIGEI